MIAGSAEQIPLPDASVDAVFAAEAFHLFATERTVGQIARVLRPGGVLVLMWNIPAGPTKPPIAGATSERRACPTSKRSGRRD